MADRDRSEHRRRPALERLEGRSLLTAASNAAASRIAHVRHEYHEFVGQLQQIELRSEATPAQYRALRDDARSISEATSSTTLKPAVAVSKALDISLQLDRSTLAGWVGDRGWAEIRTRVATTLDGLNVPPALIDRTVADMRALAESAGVTSDEYQTFTANFNTLRDGEMSLGSGAPHFPDPGLYFTQHLRGFFRGGAVQRHADQARLDADIRALGAGGRATLARDARLLEQAGAELTLSEDAQLNATFLQAFAQGPPGAPDLARMRAGLVSILGADAPASSLRAVDRLIADAPAFDQAAGSSSATIVADVGALVADGGGSSLNPFKVEIT